LVKFLSNSNWETRRPDEQMLRRSSGIYHNRDAGESLKSRQRPRYKQKLSTERGNYVSSSVAGGASVVMPAQAGIQEHMALAAGEASWIPGLALLARNDGNAKTRCVFRALSTKAEAH
jgi:hypothetical protein